MALGWDTGFPLPSKLDVSEARRGMPVMLHSRITSVETEGLLKGEAPPLTASTLGSRLDVSPEVDSLLAEIFTGATVGSTGLDIADLAKSVCECLAARATEGVALGKEYRSAEFLDVPLDSASDGVASVEADKFRCGGRAASAGTVDGDESLALETLDSRATESGFGAPLGRLCDSGPSAGRVSFVPTTDPTLSLAAPTAPRNRLYSALMLFCTDSPAPSFPSLAEEDNGGEENSSNAVKASD